MKLTHIRLMNFQSFGSLPTTLGLHSMTYLLGPNGSGKTAALMALARLFAYEPGLRRIQRSDFHGEPGTAAVGKKVLWIETEFDFPALASAGSVDAAVPAHFAHMRLQVAGTTPKLRIRLTAELDDDGEIDEKLVYVVETDPAGKPTKTVPVSRHDRASIQVYYLPARRDPTPQITYAASSLLGRALRAASWKAEQPSISKLTADIGTALANNDAVKNIDSNLAKAWAGLYRGQYFSTPNVSFENGEIDSLLKYLTVAFTPGVGVDQVDFSRLSDGQKSLLYVSLVLSMHGVAQEVLAGTTRAFDIDRLKPPVFTMIAMEEPENSLSPHYLGRIITALNAFSEGTSAQAIVATHSPSLLRRVAPENIRHLRLTSARTTTVRHVILPDASDESHKFVREAVQAFPELYFSRLVILVEGDSEEVVLPRLLGALGMSADDSAISVAPLGGRHVNHFWRLLHGLEIPYLTLLDLDIGRYQGGWGRIRYALQQLLLNPNPASARLTKADIDSYPKWDAVDQVRVVPLGRQLIDYLEQAGVFFSSPLDLDFSMLLQFPVKHGVDPVKAKVRPDDETIKAVLGKSHGVVGQYSPSEQEYFSIYHSRFKLGSKPVAHISALAATTDAELATNAPPALLRLANAAKTVLAGLSE